MSKKSIQHIPPEIKDKAIEILNDTSYDILHGEWTDELVNLKMDYSYENLMNSNSYDSRILNYCDARDALRGYLKEAYEKFFIEGFEKGAKIMQQHQQSPDVGLVQKTYDNLFDECLEEAGSIKVDRSNIEYCAKQGKLNGSIQVDIANVLMKHKKAQSHYESELSKKDEEIEKLREALEKISSIGVYELGSELERVIDIADEALTPNKIKKTNEHNKRILPD